MKALAVVVGLLLIVAGCVGVVDEQAGGEDAAGAAPAAADRASSEMVWEWEHDEGTYDGANVSAGPPVGSVTANVAPDEGDRTNFDVPEGTDGLQLQVSTELSEQNMNIHPPGCEPGPVSSCEQTVPTENHEASWERTDPEPGTWEVVFTTQADAAGDRWMLDIGFGQAAADG